MTDKSTNLPGTLMIRTTSSSETQLTISLDIPAQTIYLRGYRIEFDTAAHALAEGIIYLDIQNAFNGNRMLDTNIGQVYLPIFLDNAAVTHTFGMDIPVSLQHHLPERFNVRILNQSFVPVSNFVSAAFNFYCEKGHL